MRTILLFIILLAIFDKGAAQPLPLSGQIQDTVGKPVAYANVLLLTKKGQILDNTLSNESGAFTFRSLDSLLSRDLYLEVTHIAYKTRKLRLSNQSKPLMITLQSKSIDLSEIKIDRLTPLTVTGDTLSYAVDAFALREDRSIGEVIARLPGLEVKGDGTIWFNGRLISNMYIQGDDLMDGRYGLATRSIQKEQIKSVDIIQNHLPIKVLQNKRYTDAIAMNLVLEDPESWNLSGEVSLGATSDSEYTGSLNTIILNKTLKSLNLLKANNLGMNYQNYLIEQGQSIGSGLHAGASPSILSLGNVPRPALESNQFYFNRSGLIHLNNLYNTPADLQVKSNSMFYWDRSIFNYLRTDTLFFDEGLQSYRETQAILDHPFLADISLSAQINKPKQFMQS